MTSKHRFMALSEYGNNLRRSLFMHVSSGVFVVSLCICSSFLLTPVQLLAEEEQSAEKINIAAQEKSTEGLLATTEKMIEQLMLQIEKTRNNNPDSEEVTEITASTPLQSSIPNIKPVSGSVTSAFGNRIHPVYNVVHFHSGIDFTAAVGTRVQSTGDGVVAFSGYDRGYGQRISINHGYGYTTLYAHLSKSLVRQGQRVKRGDIIALSGNTGLSTGPHLHYEVQKNNVRVNPTAYFFDETNPGKFITTQKPAPEQSGNNS